jgi:hypothetical protein
MFEIVNSIGDEIRGGAVFEDWHENDQILEGYRCMFRSVENEVYPQFLGYGIWFYEGRNFQTLQCVWPDRDGNYPWEPRFPAELNARQPVLTQRAGWPYHVGKSRAVITTGPVLEENRPVVLVTHDQDGDWQFLCGTTNRTEDGRVVSLKSIVEKHPSVLDLVDLPIGWQAIREAPDRPWQRMRM